MLLRAGENEQLVGMLGGIGLVKEELEGFFELSFFAKRLNRIVVIMGKGCRFRFDADIRVAKGD